MGGEHRMQSRITELDPPRRLGFTWSDGAEVTIELEPRGAETLLTLTHRRLPDRPTLLGVSAGWHIHLDVLEARMRGAEPAPFWDGWRRLRAEYEEPHPGLTGAGLPARPPRRVAEGHLGLSPRALRQAARPSPCRPSRPRDHA